MNNRLPSGPMDIDKAISHNLKTVPLPLSDADRAGINTLLLWQHEGYSTVTVN